MSIFHYTNVSAVYSILLNRSIWLTDLRFLNDSRELHDGIAVLSKILKKPQLGLFANHNYKKNSINYLRNSISDRTIYGLDDNPIFIFSFSRVENLLSQWRAYGGYAIEFDDKLLSQELSGLKQCVYDQKQKICSAKTAVTRALDKISQEMGRNDGWLGFDSFDSLGELIELAATFKDEGFLEEQEFRIVIQTSTDDDSIKYSPKNNKLIPYLEKNISLNCIKAIHIGPMADQELAYTAMSSFVKKIKGNWLAESLNGGYELSVKKSSIPFRGTEQRYL